MNPKIAGIIISLAAAQALAAGADTCTIVPVPQKFESREGVFKLQPDTRILTDNASKETAEYLATRLRLPTGYKLEISATTENQPVPGTIRLTVAESKPDQNPEAYTLTVAPDSVAIQAPAQAGLFYGAQSLLQLLPTRVLSPKPVTGVDWQIPCVQIEDQPRFKWRGMLLDVSRHFFTKAEVERMLDLMALHKLNVFHWHIVDHDGWRIEIKKYPQLTKVGGWRKDIAYGLDPRASTAYGPDGRYGGFYTQDEIREVVAYAKARHITVVPEIEMPGHAGAALRSYPDFYCTDAAGTAPARHIGVYCAGKDETYAFLQDVLTEVFDLFPSTYIHVGGDEVDKSNWHSCPKCQARMKQENLKDEKELQSYFIRRIEKFINSKGRTLVGWSEIREGGLAQNAVMMDWIGGGLESASEGHDVVMTPGDYCYLDHGQSLDHSNTPVSICCYRPLRQVYAFEPIPAGLDPKFHSHILGGQANLWSEYIASANYLDYMTFPRMCAIAEAVWSPKDARNWDDFQRRLQTHTRRLDELGVYYYSDTSVKIGEWTPAQLTSQEMTLEWDAGRTIAEPGKYHVILDHTKGNALKIAWVALLEDGREIARDTHPGYAGPQTREPVAADVVYILGVPAFNAGAKHTIQAHVTADGGTDSNGIVTIDPAPRPTIR